MDLNRVTVTGRLAQAPVVRETASGKKVANIAIAIERRNIQEGEQTADFINATAFGKTAEIIEKYLDKGIKAGFDGRICSDKYEVDGKMNYTTYLLIDQVVLLQYADKKEEKSEVGQ